MIQIIFTCDRCKQKREWYGNIENEDNDIYDVKTYLHGSDGYIGGYIIRQLCPECKSELEKWLNGSLDK